VPAPPTVAPLVCRHLGREVVHMLLVLRGPPAGHSWPGRARTALDLARFGRGQRWYNWCPEEPRMFLCDAWTTVADQVKSR
jgi:hypothetical protein